MKLKRKNVDAWIARDKDGLLAIYFYKKPHLVENRIWFPYDCEYGSTVLDNESFPDVTFENSPIKVSITKP